MNLLVKRSKRTKLLVPIIRLEILESDVIGRVPPPHKFHLDSPSRKDNSMAFVHQTEQSPPVMVGKLNRWSIPALMHFKFGPCSTAAEGGRSICVCGGGWADWGEGERTEEGHKFGMLKVLWGPAPSVRCRMQPEPPLMWSSQPLWNATHVDLVIPDRKPPYSCWR